MVTTQSEEREIKSIDELCNFELLETKPTKDTPLRRFRAKVSYLVLKYINDGKGETYLSIYTPGEMRGSHRHVLISPPLPELSYLEMPGENDGVVFAETKQDLQELIRKTAVFASRSLQRDKIFSETIDIKVAEPKIEEFKPKHMAFLINEMFNYVVGKMTFEVSGYGNPYMNSPN